MTLLDRMLFKAFIRSYIICFISTLSLYIIIDLFTNIDDFFKSGRTLVEILQHLLTYYGYNALQYYDRLCEALSLLAGVFTIALVQRNNELIPILSAGVSTHRMLRPIFVGAVLMLTLGMLNQEFVIPRISNILLAGRDDPEGTSAQVVNGSFDSSRVHLEGFTAYRRDLTVHKMYVTLPQISPWEMCHITAENAQYVPPKEGEKLSGGWYLMGATPAELPKDKYDPELLIQLDAGKYFLKVNRVTFDQVTRGQKAQMFASTYQLYGLMQQTDVGRMNRLAVLFHTRIARPLLGLILIIMGLSIILRSQTRHVFISSGMCIAMCGLFYAAGFAAKFLGNADYLSPALAAWLPVLIFGPFTFALYDAIHT